MPDPQVALTTGANSGIGLATVLELARHGLHSVGTVRSKEKAREVAAAAKAEGLAVETTILDVTDAAACARVIDRFRPFAIVNNAGYSLTGAVEDVSDDEVRQGLETMLVAPIRLARLALPYMRERSAGRIVNVSSIFGVTTTPLIGWYQACKHALEAVSDALRAEVAGTGVKVILIEPGGIRTGIWSEAERELTGREGSRFEPSYRRLVSGTRMAQGLMGDPSQVARVIRRAVRARSPRPRYLVGYDAQAAAVLERVTPTAVRDRVTRTVLGL
ncbi:MAG TPA: SDR family NAD(P)-dependent oxidoreductase [Acidimicrobiales bacterium]|nr:SDR family NAD(P)-dependent oxidoreductase [Acidimicrobiales bacterium]